MDKKGLSQAEVYQKVTASVVDALSKAGEWERPWETVIGLLGTYQPVNADGKSYKGINTLLLGSEKIKKGFNANVWGTYKAWESKKGQVKKGEHGSPCVFWKFLRVEGEDKNGDPKTKTIPMARLYTVFNRDQVDGLTIKPEPAPVNPDIEFDEGALSLAQAYVNSQGIAVIEGGDRAFYSIQEDTIHMPLRATFKSAYGYHSVLFHESAHSTGAKSRLNRTFGDRFGDGAYALEEVVAELAAAYLCASCGLPFEAKEGDHAAYLKHWLAAMKADNRVVFTLASAAQKASDLVLAASEAEEAEAA